MIDVIFAIKFVHLVAAAAMLGTWFCIAVFMVLAHRSGNPSVVALTAQFVVTTETMVMIAALVLQPLSGVALALAIGLSPFGEFWILVSLVFYVAIVACWVGAFRVEQRIRDVSREAALSATPLAADYRRMFRLWSLLAGPLLFTMLAVFALMIWQPRLD
jgi:uncharacterized membrane protein